MYKYMIPGDYDCLVGSFIMNNVDAFGLDTKYKTVYETYYLKIEAKKI